MRKLFSVLFILLFSTMLFGQAEEYLIRHVGKQYGDYNADSSGLAQAITYMNTVVNADSQGIIWLDFPVDTSGQGALENIHLFGWVSDGTDTSFIVGGLFNGIVQASSINFASASVVGGTANAITMDFSPDFPALSAGLQITFVAEAANTGATTLAIDGGTAKAIVEGSDGSALEAGDIASGSVVTIIYDGTSWQQVSQSGN